MKRIIVVVSIVLLGLSILAGAQATKEQPAGKAARASIAHPVDINSATKEQLEQVPGLAGYADKIIEGRPYKAKNEIVSRGIVPMTVYDKIKGHIVARGTKGEKAEATPAAEKKAAGAARRQGVDINSASKEDLEKIPGLGNYADKIIAGRPYKAKNDLVKRNIVPMAVYDRAKDRIVANPAP